MIYFDNAASSFPKPLQVSFNINRAVNHYGANPGRSGHRLSVMASEEVYACRASLAEMFNAETQDVIFTSNATTAINTVIKGLVKKGDEVIISDLEHNSVVRPLHSVGAKIVRAKVFLYDDNLTVSSFTKALSPYTRLVICTHASNVLGKILPIKKIGEAARKGSVPFMVDAAQTGGCVNIDVKECNIDFLCLAGHKSLYGPQGTGVLILNTGINLRTLTEGGTGVNSEEAVQPLDSPERFESGTLATPAIAGLHAGIEFVKRKGIEKIFRHENGLLLLAYNELVKNPKIILYTVSPDDSFTSVLPFNVKGSPSDKVASYLDDAGICVRSGLHCAPSAHERIGTLGMGAVRASFGFFNTKSEILYMCETLKKYA